MKNTYMQTNDLTPIYIKKNQVIIFISKLTTIFSVSITMVLLSTFATAKEAEKVLSATTKAPCAKHNVLVKKPKKLKKAFKKACPGSVIRLAEGVWKDVEISLVKSGTKEHPITFKADKPGKTFIEGKSSLEIKGQYVHTQGFVFRNGSPASKRGAIVIYNSNNRLSEITIDGFDSSPQYRKTPWITLHGFHHEVSYNNLKNKSTAGVMLIVYREDDRPQHHRIHHNHFENFSSGKKENGWETIRVGTSEQSTTDSHTLIENNRFDHCDGEIEIISIKSGKNIVRGNTFIANEGLVTLRHGTNSIVENNIFLLEGKENGGGIRVYDGGHIIRNNYFSGIRTLSGSRGGVVLQSGTNKPGTDASTLNGRWTPYDIKVENNTLYNSNQNYVFSGNRPFPVENIQFQSNVVVPAKESKIMRIDLAPINARFEGEQYSSTIDMFFDGNDANFKSQQGMAFNEVSLEKNSQDLWLHETLGAQKLNLLGKDDVGTQLY